MRFVIDALGISKPGGGRTSVLMQLCSVFQLDGENQYTVIVDSVEDAFARFHNVEQRVVRIPSRLASHLVAQIAVPSVARARKAALVHYTKQLGTAFNECPYILTIHDMTTLRLPWTQSWVDVCYWKTIQRIIARRASLILTPSEDAKRDVNYYYSVDQKRIRSIPWAPSNRFAPDGDGRADATIRKRYGIIGNYVLFVGIQAIKKNLPTLVRAFDILRREAGYKGNLVIVGREYPQSKQKGLRDLVMKLGLNESVVFTGPVPDGDLPAFYRGADVFAFPSLHEGFGIVLLEAMACGTPVVASDSSSLTEVVADNGLLVRELRDPMAWAQVLTQIICDSEARSVFVEKGLRRASEFSWEKVGRETLDSYVSVVRQS